jgi:hypothetical protein
MEGLVFVTFESDSQLVVNAVHANQVENSKYLAIFSFINFLLLFHLNFKVKFVKRLFLNLFVVYLVFILFVLRLV